MKGLEELEKIQKFQFTYPILRIGKEKREATTIGKIFEKELSTIEKELKELEERREMMKRFNEACVPMILDNETENKLKALEIISKAYGEYANYKISEYELIMIVAENTTH